ncbi:MAG: polymer-forming cytoskeletal protein, partial [Deltaproteobacteria bacterium]|nr:polymer-forming cytoskeletal protein [Deltaproteobacteria bacterium]
INVASVVIQGDLVGNVRAPNCIEIHSSAHLVGNIFTPALYVEKGGIFEGNSVMESSRRAAPKTPPHGPPPIPGHP